MSRLVAITSEGEEAVVAATVETIVQARGVTTIIPELAELAVSADYEATTELEQVLWEALYQTSDGTATGATEVANPGDPTPALTGFQGFSGTEPTSGGVFAQNHFPASGGDGYRYWAEGDGWTLAAATSSRIGLRVTTTVNCNATGALRFRLQAA